MKFVIKLLLFVTLAVCNNLAFSAEMEPTKGELQKLQLASTLYEYGESEQDALALTNAAKIYFSLSARVLEKGQSEADGVAIEPEELLDKAREIANGRGDKDLVAVIDQIEATGRRRSQVTLE